MTKYIPFAALVSLFFMPFCVLAEDEQATDDQAINDAIDLEVFGPEFDDAEIPVALEDLSESDLGSDVDADEVESVTEFVDPAEQTVPVADEVDSDGEVDAALVETDASQSVQGPEIDPNASNEERLMAEFARYRRLLSDGTLDEADVAAKRIVELAIRVYGPQSRETANALNNLGIVQHGNGQFDAAIQNFTSSVEIIEAVEDRLNNALVNPLKGLGAAQLGNDRPDQAHKTFTRAVHITQVNEGPHNLDQVEILESIAETYVRMGDTKSARNILDRIHIINVKHFEKNPLGLLPSLMSRADWQHRAGYYSEERITYRRAIRVIETSSGKDDPLLVEPLRRLGQSFYFIDLNISTSQSQSLVSTGEIYFKRAARIAEKSDDMDWRDRSQATLALADYYIFVDSQNRAKKTYAQLWNILATDNEEQLAQREEWFSNPSPISAEAIPNFAGKPPAGGTPKSDLADGRIVVDYTITARGRVRNLRTEAFPEQFTDMQRIVHREIRGRIHRPRIVDGVPVEAAGLRYEHEFTYLISDLEKLREANAKADSEK